MSVTYEVNLTIEQAIAKEFEQWLVGHIDDVLAIDGFESAHWYQSLDSKAGFVTWKVDYVLRDKPALDSYLENHAPRLRQPAIDQFGSRFSAERRTFAPIKSFRK